MNHPVYGMNESILSVLTTQPWAVLPDYLNALLQGQLSSSLRYCEAISSPATAPIALLPLTGILLPYTEAFAGLGHATYLDQFQHDFDVALTSPAIQAIILVIDSPGGAVTGVNALANHIANNRGKKPILAYIVGMGASAAYWIAASTDEIIVDETASVGSIGVVSIQYDRRLQYEKAGIQEIAIVSHLSPQKHPDIQTETGRSAIQARVDSLAEVFVESIARYRQLPKETILADFGQGGLLIGKEAVSVHMVNRVGSLDKLIQKLTQTFSFTLASLPSTSPLSLARRDAMNSSNSNDTIDNMTQPVTAASETLPTLTFDFLMAAYPVLIQQIEAQGAVKERERIQAVEAQCIAGHEILIDALKWDGKTTGEEAAIQVLAAEKAQRQQCYQQLKSDAPAPVSMPAMRQIEAILSAVDAVSDAEKYQAEWRTQASLRAEFQSEAAYVAYRKAEANDQVHVLRAMT